MSINKKTYNSLPLEIKISSENTKPITKNYNVYTKKTMPVLDKNFTKHLKSMSINDKTKSTPKQSELKYKQYEAPKNQENSFSNNKIDIKISVNYLKNNNLKDLIYKQKKEETSLSNLCIQDTESKENLLRNLKNSILEEKNLRRNIISKEKEEIHQHEKSKSFQKHSLNNNFIDSNIGNISQLSQNLNESAIQQVHPHKRNIPNEFIQNNLNISLLTYDNKPLYNHTTTNKTKLPEGISPSNSKTSKFTHFKGNAFENPILLGNNYTVNNYSTVKEKISHDSSFISTTNQMPQNSSTTNLLNRNFESGSTLTNSCQVINNKLESSGKKEKTKVRESKKILHSLEKKLEDLVTHNQQDNTEFELCGQKFNIYRKILDEYINDLYQQGEPTNLINKIGNGYNEIVKSLIKQNSDNLTRIKDSESISAKNATMTKKICELSKLVDEKNSEICKLKVQLENEKKKSFEKKIHGFSSLSTEKCNNFLVKAKPKSEFSFSIDHHKQSKCGSELNITSNTIINNNSALDNSIVERRDHNKIIQNLNKNMLDDIEALYFYDKVRSNSGVKKIPIMNFNKVDETLDMINKQQAKAEEEKKKMEKSKIKNDESNGYIKDGYNYYTNNKKNKSYAHFSEINDNAQKLNKAFNINPVNFK